MLCKSVIMFRTHGLTGHSCIFCFRLSDPADNPVTKEKEGSRTGSLEGKPRKVYQAPMRMQLARAQKKLLPGLPEPAVAGTRTPGRVRSC